MSAAVADVDRGDPGAPAAGPRADRGRRGAAVAVALAGVVAVAALVLALVPAAGDGTDATDAALVAALAVDASRTVTSAPTRLVTGSDGAVRDAAPPGPLPAPLDPTGPDLPALVAGAGVPETGGLTDLIRRYFGPATVEAIVIVQCESGFDVGAVGTNTNGTQDHGLFQINDVHRDAFPIVTGRSWDDRYDAETNTAFAAWLHGHAGGWGPWNCNIRLEGFDDPSP